MKVLAGAGISVVLILVFFLIIFPLKVVFKLVGYDPLRLRFEKCQHSSLFHKINGNYGVKKSLLSPIIVGTKSADMNSYNPDTIYPLS